MQLLKITTSPMKYELEIEPARLELINDYTPSADVSSEPPKLKIETENVSVRIDTYRARKSLGLLSNADRIREQAEQAKISIAQKTREYVEEGAQLAKIEEGVTIPEIVRSKMAENPSSVTVFIPNTGADLTWDPPQVNIEYEQGELNYDWDETKPSVRYIPGSVKIKIVEHGSVNIEYLGSPMYVPPSANPNADVESPEGTN